MGADDPRTLHDSGALTPPITPTCSSHAKSTSISSDFLSTLSSLRRGDSTSSRTSTRASMDMDRKPGGAEPIYFPHHLTDYAIMVTAKGKKIIIGEGLWSDVYLARPSVPQHKDQLELPAPAGTTTPPTTPIHSRKSSLEVHQLPASPSSYAIKVPASTSAKKVIAAEGKILSYLSRFPNAERHVIAFYGLDTRTGALVLKAMDGTLETWIQQELNVLDETSRAQKLATIFPAIATSLLDSLLWMQDKDCIHADIKPSNILVSNTSSTTIPTTVFADFSSSVVKTQSSDDTKTIETSPIGAGTWEYIDPSLLSTRSPATPSASTDLWSLAITLLFLVIGNSPFDAFKHNKFQQREMIKAGAPLQCLGYSDDGIKSIKRLSELSGALGFDVQGWFAKVLVKGTEGGGIGKWKEEIVNAVAAAAAAAAARGWRRCEWLCVV
ncbi:hypothetical protein N0V83_003283 [Neocucurbitaria cava]|uniref:Autophagy-related protein 1 n=1 Tax=Neocucurbitaria cava TaxID=798079 RepID=A0A9W9CPA2_9PLEO|nr:hypothetical protein N0V83_003283 [Neocucurbitaria cava]